MKAIKNQSNAQEKVDLDPEKSIQWIRSKEVKKSLGITDSTLQSMRNQGLIPCYQLGTMLFYRLDEINDVILKSKTSINKIN